MAIADVHGRPLRNVRLSVTDRCNLRCQYCMPEEEYLWLPREDILHFEEIELLVDLFLDLGVDKVRLTGGEPLLRRDVTDLVARLARRARAPRPPTSAGRRWSSSRGRGCDRAGLHRITVSLDTLDRERFKQLARFDELDRVKAGLDAAAAHFPGFKMDTVVIRGVNDEEMIPLLDYARTLGAELRFIEYMDVGGATHWTASQVFSRDDMLARVSGHYGPVTAIEKPSAAPADRFRLPSGQIFGIIASTTQPFCAECDRSRLTADGLWYLCLYAGRGIDLRGPLRGGAGPESLKELLTGVWHARTDRGAEHRVAARERSTLIPLTALKRDPHLEMHTRGG
jgi:GTP 3',8-cyclase